MHPTFSTCMRTVVNNLLPRLGYEISPDAMLVLFNRFARKRRHMHIDDFASCLSRVKVMDGELDSIRCCIHTGLLTNHVKKLKTWCFCEMILWLHVVLLICKFSFYVTVSSLILHGVSSPVFLCRYLQEEEQGWTCHSEQGWGRYMIHVWCTCLYMCMLYIKV